MAGYYIETHTYLSPGAMAARYIARFPTILFELMAGNLIVVAVTVDDGRTAISTEITFTDGETQTYVDRCWGILDGQPYPVRYITDSPGWNPEIAADTGSTVVIDLTFVEAAFAAYINDGLCAYLATVTGETVSSPDVLGEDVVTDYQIILSLSYRAGDALDSVCCVVNYAIGVQQRIDTDDGFEIRTAFEGTTPAGIGVNVAADVGALTSIAQSLQDIALRGYDLSINHGQAIFSVNGTVVGG